MPNIPASTTVIGLSKRFDTARRGAVERANARLVNTAFGLLTEKRRTQLCSERPTIDLDPTDTEVYGRNKEGSAYNYQGQRAYRPHPAVWAEAGWVLAAEFGSGRSDPRPEAAGLLARALSALPEGSLAPSCGPTRASSTPSSPPRPWRSAATTGSRSGAAMRCGAPSARSLMGPGERPSAWTPRWPSATTSRRAGRRGHARSAGG